MLARWSFTQPPVRSAPALPPTVFKSLACGGGSARQFPGSAANLAPATLLVLSAILVAVSLTGCGKFTGAADSSSAKLETVSAPGQFAGAEPNGTAFVSCGRVAPGQTFHGDITIKNTGDKPWKLETIIAGCACTSAKPSSSNVSPGGEITLAVEYKAGKVLGEDVRSVECRFGPEVPGILTIKVNATVVPRWLSLPDDLTITGTPQEVSRDYTFKLYQYESTEWDSIDVSVSGSDFKFLSATPSKSREPHPKIKGVLPKQVWDISLGWIGTPGSGETASRRNVTLNFTPVVGGKPTEPQSAVVNIVESPIYEMLPKTLTLGATQPVLEREIRTRLLINQTEGIPPDLTATLSSPNSAIELHDVDVTSDLPRGLRFGAQLNVALPEGGLADLKKTASGLQHPDWYIVIKLSNGKEVRWPLAWTE